MRTEVFTRHPRNCEISLVHNGTFVDLNQSDMECSVFPENPNPNLTWQGRDKLESKTGFIFQISYGGEVKNNVSISSRILRAEISRML